MQGLIVINAYPNGEKFIRQAERIAEELRAVGISVDILRNGEVYSVIKRDGNICVRLPQLYDFVVYLDKDKYLGKALESGGLRLFNPSSAVEVCDDKVSTYLALKNAGVAMIKTIPAPLCYTPNAKVDISFLDKVVEELSLPLVLKKSYGSFGAGVFLAHTKAELYEKAKEWLYTPHCYQQFVSKSAGRDIRVIVIGEKAVAAMERVAQKGEFRSNIELGGVGKNICLSEEYAHAAERAATALGLDYCGVDLLQGEEGVLICEVNSNAFFEGLEKTTGINVAQKYAQYIARTLLL